MANAEKELKRRRGRGRPCKSQPSCEVFEVAIEGPSVAQHATNRDGTSTVSKPVASLVIPNHLLYEWCKNKSGYRTQTRA